MRLFVAFLHLLRVSKTILRFRGDFSRDRRTVAGRVPRFTPGRRYMALPHAHPHPPSTHRVQRRQGNPWHICTAKPRSTTLRCYSRKRTPCSPRRRRSFDGQSIPDTKAWSSHWAEMEKVSSTGPFPGCDQCYPGHLEPYEPGPVEGQVFPSVERRQLWSYTILPVISKNFEDNIMFRAASDRSLLKW